MCNPMAAMALSGASMLAKNRAGNRAERAQKKVIEKERERQEKFSEEARARSQKQLDQLGGEQSLGRVDESRDKQNAFHDQALAGYGAGDLDPAKTRNLRGAGDTAVRDEIVRGLGEAKQRSRNKSELDAYGRETDAFNRGLRRTSSDIGFIGRNAQRSMRDMELDLEKARNKGSGWGFFGDILGGGASVAATYGANRPTPAATPKAATASKPG